MIGGGAFRDCSVAMAGQGDQDVKVMVKQLTESGAGQVELVRRLGRAVARSTDQS
jgi:hypothetical protein